MRFHWTYFFFSFRIPLLDHSIYQYEIGPFLITSQSTKQPSHRYGYGKKKFWQCTSQGFNNREEESRGIWRVFMWRLLMNQSCFSLEFLSQNSFWKLSIFHGYKGLYIVGREGMWKSQFFPNRVVWRLRFVIGLSREFKPRANGLASLGLLSCSATARMTLQLPCMLHMCASFGGLPVASHPRVPATSLCILAQSWAFLHTLSLTTLT